MFAFDYYTKNRLNLPKKNFPHADVEDARSMNVWEEIKHLFRKRSTEEEEEEERN